MRRSTVKVAKLAGALGIVLALPLSLVDAVGAEPARDEAAVLRTLAETPSILDAWRDYALAELALGFSWATGDRPIAPMAPSLFDRSIARLAPPAPPITGVVTPPVLQVSYFKTRIGDTPALLPSAVPDLLPDYVPGLQRYVVAPTVAQRWGEHSALRVAAIFAYQRYAGLGLGLVGAPMQDGSGPSLLLQRGGNVAGSYGVGMRVDLSSELGERLHWQLGYQSRINMDAFNNYRGVYSEPGSFDVPASANLGFGYTLTPNVALDVGVERVMYGAIAPFTSDALPTRFLVLLGSEVSPAFTWQNLTVYSVGASLRDPTGGVWSLHYSTREQPLPTSRLLQNALEPYLATHHLEFGFTHGFGDSSNLRIAATYAPSQFVLGLPTSFSLRNGNNGGQIEYDVLWTTRF